MAFLIKESISRDQAARLILSHATAQKLSADAKLTYQSKPGWWGKKKPVEIWLCVDNVESDHFFHVTNKHSADRHEISVTLSRRMPREYHNAFCLYCLGLALEHFNRDEGGEWGMTGSQLDPYASQVGFDMILLSEGQRAVTELPWRRSTA